MSAELKPITIANSNTEARLAIFSASLTDILNQLRLEMVVSDVPGVIEIHDMNRQQNYDYPAVAFFEGVARRDGSTTAAMFTRVAGDSVPGFDLADVAPHDPDNYLALRIAKAEGKDW